MFGLLFCEIGYISVKTTCNKSLPGTFQQYHRFLHFKTTAFMRKAITVFIPFLLSISVSAQVFSPAKKYSAAALKQDLAFLKEQLFTVHANPFTELTKEKYEQLFRRMETSLNDSMTVVEFFKLVKPSIANLSDEHSDISLPGVFANYDGLPVFLPFTLRKVNKDYQVDSVLSQNTGLVKGMIITKINNKPIEGLVKQSATYASGFPDQRQRKALEQFGYLYTLGTPFQTSFTLTIPGKRTITIKGVPFSAWQEYFNFLNGRPDACPQLISYQRFGETGYINACSFSVNSDSAYEAYGKTVDSIFDVIKRDKVKQVLIDVSQNSGGNSGLGDFILQQFYTGDCLTYQMNWRRSDSYLNTIKSWGMRNEQYEKMKPGEIMHYGPDTSRIEGVKDKYTGKVYIVIGNGTFSSAIMFATIIKDNKIATLIGEEPKDGHPTHFGEMYSAKLPNTELGVRFGVKEWIRPAGKGVGNRLEPDVRIGMDRGIEGVIGRLPK